MHSPKHRVIRLDSLTLPSATQLEVNELQPQAEHGCPSTLIDNERHHTRQSPRSPCATRESVPVAEYQEWPFQGFLKRTRIRNETTYNLEFKLPRISGRLNLPIPGEALGTDSSREASAQATTAYDILAHSKAYPTAMRPQPKQQRNR
jgi:hypothetical protein